MKEKPILFSGPMIKAILDGSKTQTRRVIKSRHESGLFQVSRRVSDNQITNIESLDWDERNCEKDITCPYGQVGDILWVRETLYWDTCGDEWCYQAGNDPVMADPYTAKILLSEVARERGCISSIHMPREACRLRLEITDVRVERLHDIPDEDILSEGVRIPMIGPGNNVAFKLGEKNSALGFLPEGCLAHGAPALTRHQLLLAFWAELWCQVNGRESWDSNPWTWVVNFKVIQTEPA